jgi:hypothetical protein
LYGIPVVDFDAGPSLVRDQGGSHDLTDKAFYSEIAVELRITRVDFVDKGEVLALDLESPNQFVEITLAGADRSQIEYPAAVFMSDMRDSNRIFMDIQSNVKRARLAHD